MGLKVGLIVRQLADLYIHPSPGCKEWDLCAPCALLEPALCKAAGARDGKPPLVDNHFNGHGRLNVRGTRIHAASGIA